MSSNTTHHLITLKEILQSKDENLLFLCIQDLVSNGLTLSRFSEGERKPSRQDITQFIASWLKYVGLSADECRDWMIEYCLDVLAVISSSSASQIRHSTKSNLKYIYGSDVVFHCGCENNIFKASCDINCPVHEEMAEKYRARIEREANKSYEIRPRAQENIYIPPPDPVKEKYKEQFEIASRFICDSLKDDLSKKEIIQLLNERGLVSRTGRKWTYANLQMELKKQTLQNK